MKRAKQQDGSNSMDRISELPKEILQRILYFLSQKEAVRTSVLSKSWRNIWCTRPNLDFLEAAFNGNLLQFLSVVDSTLKRYRDQRLCVDEFHLCVSVGDLDHRYVSVLRKWIRMLTDMRVKKLCLCNRFISTGRVQLPSIAFRAESLQDLQLERFVLNRKTVKRIVLFKHLTSLSLQRVSIEDKILKRIISCCPSIETLDVAVCTRLRKINVSDLHSLKVFLFLDVNYDSELCCIEIRTPSIETIDIIKGNIWFHKGEDFRNLKDLSLFGVKSSLEHLSSCKFPRLECLSLSNCDGLKEIELFIDAPNIEFFSYYGNFIPSISFATVTSSRWDSDLDLKYDFSEDASSWFAKLQELLDALSESQIALSFTQRIVQENINYPVQDVNGGNKPASLVVESLRFRCPSSSIPSLLNGAFSICRPRNIEDYVHDDKRGRERLECLWEILMQRDIGEGDQFSQLWFLDLEEVRMEIYDDSREGWHSVSLSELQTYLDNHGRKEWHPTSSPELEDCHDKHGRKEWHPRNLLKFRKDKTMEPVCTSFRLKWSDLAV